LKDVIRHDFLSLTIYIVALGNINRTPMMDPLTFFAQRKGNRLSVRERVSGARSGWCILRCPLRTRLRSISENWCIKKYINVQLKQNRYWFRETFR